MKAAIFFRTKNLIKENDVRISDYHQIFSIQEA